MAGLCSAVAGNASGNRLVQVPDLRLTGGLTYTINTSSGTFTGNADAAYTSKFYWDPDNIVSQKGYVLLNTSVSFSPAAYPHITVRAFADNLTSQKFYSFELPTAGGAGNLAAPGEPRTYGFEVSFKL